MKVLQINRGNRDESNISEPAIKKTLRQLLAFLLTRTAFTLGFMQYQNDPTKINGTAIFFAILFGLSVVLFMFKSTILFAFFMDSEMQQGALDVTAVRRIEDKFNKSETKRAQIIDFLKKGGEYKDLPEELKIFESSQADKDQLHRKDEVKPN